MDFHEKQIPPPRSWEHFEELCLQLFKAVWNDPLAQKNGRRGQTQHGVDVSGAPGGPGGAVYGVQCKGKDLGYGGKVTVRELEEELSKAEKFRPTLAHWLLVTTAPKDVKIEQRARELSNARRLNGLFPVQVLGWEDIQSLIASHPAVIEQFYPEHAFNLPVLMRNLSALPKGEQVAELLDLVRHAAQVSLSRPAWGEALGTWQSILFSSNRDLGPALLGRSLGPGDALACPRLVEADLAVAQLKRAFAAQLVGMSGAGKSICMYQAAHTLAQLGWEVLRFSDAQATPWELPQAQNGRMTLYLIDDAHLAPRGALRALEEQAQADRLLLSTANASETNIGTARGAIALDPKRAVRTIAAGLRADRQRTLDAVRRADDSVGDGYFDVELEERIDHAEEHSKRPWQFCFILGGGWRRTRQATDAARAAGADLVLAAVALRQLATRDAQARRTDIAARCFEVGIDAPSVNSAVTWLCHERLLISEEDLRCPHQGFAAQVLRDVHTGQDKEGREKLIRLYLSVLRDPTMPIGGLRNLMGSLHPGDALRWHLRHCWNAETSNVLLQRCLATRDTEDRSFAALLLGRLVSDILPPREALTPHIERLGQWVTEAQGSTSYGVGDLVNSIYNQDKDLAEQLVDVSNPAAVANIFSNFAPADAYGMGYFAGRIGIAGSKSWSADFTKALDRPFLLRLAASWPKDEPLSSLAELCKGLLPHDEGIAVAMVESALPVLQEAFARDAFGTFRELHDMAMLVLRVFDPLGLFKGANKADPRRIQLAKRMISKLDPAEISRQLSAIRKRDFQPAANFLLFVHTLLPAKSKMAIAGLDWTRIEETIGAQWAELPHDIAVLLSLLGIYKDTRGLVSALVQRNLNRIEALPPRLAVITPDSAINLVESGRSVALARHGQFEWQLGAMVVTAFVQKRPDLLPQLLDPFMKTAGQILSNRHPSWFNEAGDFLRILEEAAPAYLQALLDGVDVTGAEEGWTASLSAGDKPRQTVALLIRVASSRQDSVGDLARRLRKRLRQKYVPSGG
ncbi:hypothetical protein [Corallococcus carmarthensis]|uniref:hypothetical protein n=1 Tax=Corallococcus carmarthensis TaxID=2316728 RepID=UPI00148E6046|nr:hypothetical protein [Corallococcus carmarthensis]NOK23626.1 hypothetical protein [Corallococcus carmarthensis]